MPIPTPHAGESEDDFIGRCNSELADEFPDPEQRNAVCFGAWRDSRSAGPLTVNTFSSWHPTPQPVTVTPYVQVPPLGSAGSAGPGRQSLLAEGTPLPVRLPPLERRVAVVPQTINQQTRTVEVVWSTGARVLRGGFFTEPFHEELSLDAKHVRLLRLASGSAPVLDSHDAWDTGSVIGVVETASVDGGQGHATVRFAKDDQRADSAWNKIKQGILRNISVGYRVHRYQKVGRADDELPVLRAVDWEPYELSVVPIPADGAAQIRSPHPTDLNQCLVVSSLGKENGAMDNDQNGNGTPQQQSFLEPKPPVIIPEVQRAAPQAAEPTELELGKRSEQERIQGILRACEAARLDMKFANDLIARNVPLLEAQSIVLDTLRKRGHDLVGPGPTPQGPQVQFPGADPLENVWRGITDAILHKAAPQYFPLSDIGRPYRSRSLLAAAELCLHHRGIRTGDLTKMELAARAFGLETRAGYHTTSDFANILADVSNKLLRAAYQEAPQTFAPIARRITVSDFKPVNMVQLGEAPALLEVKEHGEFTRGTIGDSKEQFTLATYGRVFAITRKALVNDDIEAFARLTTLFGRSARNKESDLVWAQITANANMSDGIALFDATTHKNYVSSGTAIAVDKIGEGYAMMRLQKALDGVTPLNLVPRYLVVPVEKEVVALQYTTQIQPAQGSNVNPFSGRLEVITEPRLSAASTTAWYLFAGTDQIDIVVYGFLDGEEGPVVESRVGFDVDGLEVKCRHDVAAKILDWRGAFKNVGA